MEKDIEKEMKDKILLKLRKATTPYHIICGFITVLSGAFVGVWLVILCFISFLIIQIWTKKEWKTSQNDFWEYCLGIFCCSGILLMLKLILFILKLLGVI